MSISKSHDALSFDFLGDVKCISFDIFDTLVHRTVASPTQVFLLMGQEPLVALHFDYAHNWEQQRILAEHKARQKATKANRADISLVEIYQQFKLDTSVIDALIELELSYEDRVLVANPVMDELILKAKQAGKLVICCSDMYLSEQQIRVVALSKLKHFAMIDHIYVSNEINATKAEGALFDYVLNCHQLQPQQLMHIGDNERSDFQTPLTKGIKAYCYAPSYHFSEVLDRERSFVTDNDLQLNLPRRLAALQNTFKNKQQLFFYEMGATVLGPVLFGFAHWLLDYARQKQLKQIVTIMREGSLFKHALEAFQRLYPEYSDIEIKLIYASRKALFLPFLSSNSNYNRYAHLTIADLFSMFDLLIPVHLEAHSQIRIDDAMEIYPDVFDDVVAYMSTQKSITEQKEKEQKSYFLRYLLQEKINRPLYVDFGGGGTVLKQLSGLPEPFRPQAFALLYQDVGGVDLPALKTFLPVNRDTYHGLVQMRRSAGVYEIMLNGFESTTTGYKLTETNEIAPIQPRLPDFFNELSLQEQLFQPMKQGIDNYFFQYNYLPLPIMDMTYRNNLANMLTRLVAWPTKQEIEQLGQLPFESDFDGKTTVPFIGMPEALQEHDLVTVLSDNLFKRSIIEWPRARVMTFAPLIFDNLYVKFHKTTGKHGKSINKIINVIRIISSQQPVCILKVAVWGAGVFGEALFAELKAEKGVQVVTIVDTRAKVATVEVNGQSVFEPEYLFSTACEHDLLIIASEKFKISIRNAYHELAERYGKTVKKIVQT
jgi:FMN phosphatase YigB (HAD superfamily)